MTRKLPTYLRSDYQRISTSPLAYRLTLPIVVLSEANQRGSWKRKHYGRSAPQRDRVHQYLVGIAGHSKHVGVPASVTFTRVGPALLDDDNLAGAFKAIRDEVAKWFGVDDGPSGPITWRYEQRRQSDRGIEIVFAWGGLGEVRP